MVKGVSAMGLCATGLELEGALELSFASPPVPLEPELGAGERRVGFRQGCVEFERLRGRRFGLWADVAGGRQAEHGERSVSVSETCVSWSVSRVSFHGRLEILDAPSDAFRAPSVQLEPTLQIRFVGLAVYGVAGGSQVGLLQRCQLNFDFSG